MQYNFQIGSAVSKEKILEVSNIEMSEVGKFYHLYLRMVQSRNLETNLQCTEYLKHRKKDPSHIILNFESTYDIA